MTAPPVPPHESRRVAALRRLRVLDTGPEAAFDDLVSLASDLLGMPMAMVSLVDRDRQWFKARVGLEARETPRDHAFCAHAIGAPDVTLVVPDALLDPRFSDNPLVTGPLGVRFYAGAPLRTPEGDALGTLCVVDREPRAFGARDLRILETLARQATRLLELRDQVRELGTAQEQAEALLERAEAATRLKSQFLANTSHEIRTPLHGITGTLDLLRSTALGEEQSQLVDLLQTSADTLRVLLDDVLDAAKVEAGQMRVEHIPVAVGSLIHGVADLFRVRADEKLLEFEVSRCGSVPDWLSLDPVRLRQIVSNLVSNAIKFTEDGHVRVAFLVDGTPGQGGELVVRVSDTGIGMTGDQLGRLFRSFAQGEASITREYGGTGLGLYISRELARLMGGDPTVSSRVDEGSTFELRVPAVPAAPPEQVAEIDPVGSFSGRVLVVEDHPVNQLVASRMLRSFGLEVTVAESGADALEHLAGRDRPDLVLMDLHMPGMDGFETARRLRAAGHRMPVVALTAHGDAGVHAACREAGMDGMATKPIRRARLGELLREHRLRPAEPGSTAAGCA